MIERRRGYLSGSGAYVHGDLCGVRRRTYEFPYAAGVVCAFVTSVAHRFFDGLGRISWSTMACSVLLGKNFARTTSCKGNGFGVHEIVDILFCEDLRLETR